VSDTHAARYDLSPMTLLVALALRNATRNVQRTLLTAATVVLGTALLVVAFSWMDGIFGQLLGSAAAAAGHVRVVDPEYAKREELLPLYENVPDATALGATLLTAPGVRAAYPRVTTGATLTVGEEIGDVFAAVIGAPKAWYTDELDLDAPGQLTGRLADKDDELAIGATLADTLGAKLGDEVVLLGMTQDGAMSPMKATIVGIVRTDTGFLDQTVFGTLPAVQYMADIGDGATEVLVYGADRDEAAALAATIAPRVPGLEAQAWSTRDPWSAMLPLSETIRGILASIIVFMCALGVWNTMTMSVLERTGEIGVMRAMGLGRAGAVFLFVVEACVIAVLGGGVGVGLGAIGGWLLETRGVELGRSVVQSTGAIGIKTHMYGDLTFTSVGIAFGMGLLMAVVGAMLPALRAAAIDPVAAMRTRR
jgi:putative ABC transport system permease protein